MAMEFLKLGVFLDVPRHILIGIDTEVSTSDLSHLTGNCSYPQEERLVKVPEEEEFFMLVQDASVVDGDLLSWTRKLKELLENNLGWEFQQNSAVDGMYFEYGDEFAPVVEMLDDPSSSAAPAVDHLLISSAAIQRLQFHPVVEMLDDPSCSETPAVYDFGH